MLNILIPMSGRGQRFIDAGYQRPKPLIDVGGMPMIYKVASNLFPSEMDFQFTFLCLKEFLDKYSNEFNDYLALIIGEYNVIEVDKVTDGAACTALLAKDIINTDDELIISDCDHLVLDYNHIGRGIEYFRKNNADGGIWCFLNDSNKWSYVRVRDNKIKEVVEKEVVSNLANTGTFYFKTGKLFVKYAEMMIGNNDRSKGEFYISPVYNYIIANVDKVTPFLVNEMVGLGTPADLDNYRTKINARI